MGTPLPFSQRGPPPGLAAMHAKISLRGSPPQKLKPRIQSEEVVRELRKNAPEKRGRNQGSLPSYRSLLMGAYSSSTGPKQTHVVGDILRSAFKKARSMATYSQAVNSALRIALTGVDFPATLLSAEFADELQEVLTCAIDALSGGLHAAL